MATQHPDLFAALAAPFDSSEVKVRSAASRQVHYITARTAMNRLDNVLGPEGWWDEYVPGENSVLCRLTIRMPDGSTLTKADAGGYAGMADQGDDDKSGYSDSFKRAAVKFGIARYLYRDGVPTFVQERAFQGKTESDPEPSREPHGHDPRQPEPRRESSSNGHQGGNGQSHGNGQHSGPPRTGKALFAWTKDQEQKYQVGLLKYINGWAKLQEFPGRMIDWDTEQVAFAHAEMVRKLASVTTGASEPGED